MNDPVVGIVLAGGESRRMGRDKALVPLLGRPLASWTIARLAPQVTRLAISRHDGRCPELDTAYPILLDREGERLGPLAGILAGLDWAATVAPTSTHAVTVGVDLPLLPTDFVERLLAHRSATGSKACVAMSAGRRHPVAALWPLAARPTLWHAFRVEGLRRVGVALERLDAATVAWSDRPYDPFSNANTPSDLAVIADLLRTRQASNP